MTTTVNFDEVLVKVSNGASPEVFAHPCIINLGREFSFTPNFQDDLIPECHTPSAPSSIRRQVLSVDHSISGEGKVHLPDLAVYITWARTGEAKNVQLEIGSGANGVRISGAYYCGISSPVAHKETANITITLTPVDTGAITQAALS